ncbi:MAG: amidohydrolase family protein [Mogibacterium sp.]|nr:amidohydrolase family protein [Mogibacterium sp.]
MKGTVLIRGGRVLCPLQKLDRVTNVSIRNGKIEAITDELPEADRVIDARDRIVAPGFIDIHMHEGPVLHGGSRIDDGIFRSALLMGVTTDIGGNCGDNVCDPAEYLDLMEEQGLPVHLGLLAGHTWLRNRHGKKDKYQPVSAEDTVRMRREAEGCLEAGCLGVSFGPKYIPGCSYEEMLEVASCCKGSGKLLAMHVRNDVEGVFDAAAELARLGRDTESKVQFSHIGSMGGYGQMDRLLEQIGQYRDEGIDLMADCYPYDAFSTAIGNTTYDPEYFRAYQSGYENILIVSGKYAGRRCDEAIFAELRRDAPETATVGYFMRADEIGTALRSPLVMLGSDGIRTEGKGHPRSSGTFPKFIREYLLTGKIPMLEGIAKMTSLPAERLQLTRKGNLRAGSDADIVICDPETIRDRATYEDGQVPPDGIDWVLVGGEVAADHGTIVRADLGRPVRR